MTSLWYTSTLLVVSGTIARWPTTVRWMDEEWLKINRLTTVQKNNIWSTNCFKFYYVTVPTAPGAGTRRSCLISVTVSYGGAWRDKLIIQKRKCGKTVLLSQKVYMGVFKRTGSAHTHKKTVFLCGKREIQYVTVLFLDSGPTWQSSDCITSWTPSADCRSCTERLTYECDLSDMDVETRPQTR